MIFSECIGNNTAQAALSRMVEHNALPHTLLFYGPKGVGKGLCALRLAEALMGSSPRLANGNHPDLHQLYPEGKAGLHPVENIRALVKEAAYPPLESPLKLFIIHDAHQMLAPSSNALLKTLEEPIAHTYFVLITHQREALLPTIVSRARGIPFFSIPDQEIACYAKEHWSKNPKEAQRIAFLSHGSFAKARQLALQPTDEIRTRVRALLTLSLPQEYGGLLSLCGELEELLTPDQEGTAESTASQIDDLLEEIFAWYRDLHLLKNNIAAEHLYHLDAIEQLRRAAMYPVPPLEEVLKRLFTVRASLQRHIKLRVSLEHFFTSALSN